MANPPELTDYPQPPIIKRNGFQFCMGVFSVGNVARIDGSRLHELFKPSTLRLKRDQKDATEEARRLFRKPFFVAQLRYYGISFKSSAGKATLQLLLHDAVLQGKCNNVPKSVMELESSMRADYEPLQQEWEADCAVWNEEKRQRDDEAFKSCKTPGERAAFDLHRFMDVYFLTNGKPDQTKTTEALALHGFHENIWKLRDMTREVAGLHIRSGGFLSVDVICIGWDREEVTKLAKSITDRELEAMNAQKEALWEEQLEIHRKYVARVRPEETANGVKKGPKVFNLDLCQGSYAIQCDEITDGWFNILKGRTLTMDISKGNGNTLLAAYDFGIIEGTMILGLSEHTLQDIVGEDSAGSETSDEGEEDDDEDDADLEDSTTIGTKRKPAQAAGSSVIPHTSAKRRKTSPLLPTSHRVYFRLYGRETGEGEVLPYPDSGHIDFPGGGYASFVGLVNELTHVGSKVEFRGYKVSDRPRVKPEPWQTFLYGRYGF